MINTGMEKIAEKLPSGWRQLITRMLVAGLITTVAGCGFHLRGSGGLPAEMSVTYVKSARQYGTLIDDFAAALRVRDVQVTEVRADATAVLTIIKDDYEREVLSVNTAGKVLEFELRQTIRFSVITGGGLPLVEDQSVSMSRAYLYSSTDVLGKQREERVVRNTLQKNLVNLAMLRIEAAAR
jgi:LPS-assembly lipoprotein